MSESFFVTPEAEPCAILLVDSSYSVKSPSGYPGNNPRATIFDEMQRICCNLPHKKFRVLFWNSNNAPNNFGMPINGVGGIRGVVKITDEVPREELAQCFKLIAMNIVSCCVTEPHLGFINILDWLKAGYSQTVYFLTDGLIGWNGITHDETTQLQRQLADSIRQIIAVCPRVQLTIIAVEQKHLNTDMEQSQMVGNDIFRGIAGMTWALTQYISYAPNKPINGHVPINKLQTVPGFVPFGKRSFSILSTSEFMNYLSALIESKSKDEDELLRIIQDLSVTLNVLTKERPQKMREQTLNIFIQMFDGTVISEANARFILSQGVAAEACGSAQLYADYRSNLKSLFADASRLLLNNVSDALGVTNESLTLPLKAGPKRIIVISKQTAARETVLNHKNAGYMFSGMLVPMLPFISANAPLMTKQCLRQWIRALIAKEYNMHTTSDEIIFVVMGLNFQTQMALLDDKSEIANRVRLTYRNIVSILLEKKRLNSQSTEMEALLAGNLFVPNDGNVKMFTTYLNNVAKRLCITVEPLLLWYALCLAHSKELAASQWRHCQQVLGSRSTLQDFTDWPTPAISIYEIPEQLEYECCITFESTEKSGGKRFLPHEFASLRKTTTCRPNSVLSEQGYLQLFNGKETAQCPICYRALKERDFENVGPMGNVQNQSIATLETNRIFLPSSSSSSSSSPTSSSSSSSLSVSSLPGRLIVLIGTVGCGKTTYAKQLKEIAERENRHCIVEGTDKYCMQGLAMKDAIAATKNAIINACNLQSKDKTIVLDVCNERFNASDVFGVDLSSWNIQRVEVNLDRNMIPQYLAWSLRNVLIRNKSDSFLNPPTSTLAVCIKVHLRKAKSLFGQQTTQLVAENTGKEKALATIKQDADAYQTMLDSNAEKFKPVF